MDVIHGGKAELYVTDKESVLSIDRSHLADTDPIHEINTDPETEPADHDSTRQAYQNKSSKITERKKTA